MNKILTTLINGELIFGKENKTIFNLFKNSKSSQNKNLKKSFAGNDSGIIDGGFDIKDIKKSSKGMNYNNDRLNFNAPNGYVYTRMVRINMEELAINHKLSLDYLRAGGDLYIKNIILNKTGQIINVYHNGENKLIEIIKLTDQDLQIKLEEWSGNVEEYQIHSGSLV